MKRRRNKYAEEYHPKQKRKSVEEDEYKGTVHTKAMYGRGFS
jgi:hypothetical protein